jgi:L-lactate dehydrogenase complex protein LldG
MNARDEILTKVKAAIATAPHSGPIPRDYRATTNDNLDTFLDRLAHYDATTHVVAEADLDWTVRDAIQDKRIIVPDGVPHPWTNGVDALKDDPPLTHQDLDQAEGVITTCALAIAQTGTIVLDGGPGMGRRALTLLPDYHLCVVRTDQIVSSVPEAIQNLENRKSHPLTFVSGPSATVDIEMTRVRGVHGPRRLEVIVATGAQADPKN